MSETAFYNQYPIILVHGFLGWGRDELFGFKYWGGSNDIEEKLNNQHYRAYTATVGPISSSWERACELYHYLVGGTVDYGAAHSAKYGISRYGRTFAGIYPSISNRNKVHLVGHSMGAQTICDLETFLRDGSQEERDHHESNPGEGISGLFLGGHNWIHSITGLAPAFNGSLVCNDIDEFMTFTKTAILGVAALAGGDLNEMIYDFKLDQWGLKREDGEHFLDYMERVCSSGIWQSQDTAFTDLSTPGAKAVANRLQVFPDTYYFANCGCATFTNPKTGYSLPQPSINPLLTRDAYLIGRYRFESDLPGGDSAWWPNDGLVSCAGGNYILGQPNRAVTTADTMFKPGIWNYFPVKNGWDHIDFIGVNKKDLTHQTDIMDYYSQVARLITSTEHHAPNHKER